MGILAEYENGNCHVTLHGDGTKIREWPDGESAKPMFPESVDLKITNTCDMGCAWCHESATKLPDHAPVGRVLNATEGLSPGVEIAIGGGNPLAYPSLGMMLREFANRGLVSNMTVNGDHLLVDGGACLKQLQSQGLLHGVGISGGAYNLLHVNDMLPLHAVYHTVVGVDDPFDVIRLGSCAAQAGSIAEGADRSEWANVSVLILGYKAYGRGATYRDGKPRGLARWRYFIGAILREPKRTLSFDNLALEQLGVKDLVDESTWAKHYMGDDGQFTMYYDAVADQYAVSSTSERHDAEGLTIREMFEKLQSP